LFGGKRGGRPRNDGLIPGSADAIEADKKKDRDRKAASVVARNAAPVPVQPAPLPGQIAPGATQPPPGGLVPVPVINPDAWTAQEAQPLVVHSLPVVEHLLTARRLAKLREAKMPGPLIMQVKSDSAWPPTVKETLNQSLPGSAAKLLTFVHFPKFFKDELSSLPALALLIQHEMAVNERLDKIIADWKKEHPELEKKEPEKKP
jgi:hypothetical protein